MKITYSPESVDDLQRVVEFVESKNPFAARRRAIDIQEGVEKLKQFPLVGLPVINGFAAKQIRDLYISNYTIRYLAESKKIHILRVWHNKENEKNL